MHGGPPPVQSRSDEHDRIPVETSLTPLMARTVANRRAARPRHTADPDHRPRRTGAIAAVGVLLLVVAVGAMAALWPQASGDGMGLEASGVTTTEPFGDSAERASASRSNPSTSEGAATGSTDSTGSTGTTGSPGSTSTETTDGEGETGSTGSTGSTGTTSGGSSGGTASTSPSTSESPSTAPPPASTPPPPPSANPPATTTTTAPPSTTAPPRTGDPRQDATWDALARCETNGNWSYNGGDGRYGGLRMRDEDWRDHGGRGYPHQYSRDTQITVARRLQADEGWDYWGRCARQLGYD